MDDIFDNLFLHFFSMMLAAFKITNFIDWSWWLVAAPSIVAVLLAIFARLSSSD